MLMNAGVLTQHSLPGHIPNSFNTQNFDFELDFLNSLIVPSSNPRQAGQETLAVICYSPIKLDL